MLSHLYNIHQECKTLDLFRKVIDKIILYGSENSPFLIIITDVDSCNKCRNNWFLFLDMLEDTGFSGHAYARSAHPDSDLEHLTKPKSDQSGSKGEKSQMDISPAFISDEQAPVSMEPGKGSLNNPAVLSKMRGTVHPTSGNAVLYMSHGARLSAKRKIVPFISVKFLRMTSGSPVQISQGRQMIQHIFQHFAIIHIGGSEADNKRNTIAIRYEMMFASRTTSIYGVGSCVFAPLFAWMTEPSIQALLQSIFFVSCKFCRMTW